MPTLVHVTKIELGASSGSKETITEVKRVGIGAVPSRHQPRTTLNAVSPVGWRKPHKYLIFEFHCLNAAEVYEAIYHNGSGPVAYDVPDGDNPDLPYCKIFYTDNQGAGWTRTLTGAIIDGVDDAINDGEDLLAVIRVSAYQAPLVKT